jgi:hypothetical protein
MNETQGRLPAVFFSADESACETRVIKELRVIKEPYGEGELTLHNL